jgi:hypothetical protein
MTIKELYDAVAQLGFEDSLEDNARFLFATNRAISEVGKIRPATAIYKIEHHPLPIMGTAYHRQKITNGSTVNISGAKAFFFECNGSSGNCVVKKTNGDVLKEITFSSTNKEYTQYKGFIKDDGVFYTDDVVLVFNGDYRYSVRNLVFYDTLDSANESDIPSYDTYVKYDLAVLTTDFLSLVQNPINDVKEEHEFRINSDYFVEKPSKILLPYDAVGTYEVTYNRKRVKATSVSTTETVDLDDDLCEILPYLVASDIWADDEPSKAEYYLMRYRELEAKIINAERKPLQARIRNVSGW